MKTLLISKCVRVHRRSCTCIILFMLSGMLYMDIVAQENIDISGRISAGGEVYAVQGVENRRSPYSYQVNGRLVFSYKDFSVPVSGSYRDAQFSYDYTFNRIGIAPTWKWIKVYLGWNTVSFSPYTMSGRAFNGAGVELKPGLLSVTAIKGKIQNPLAIRDTLVDGATLIPIYDRLITGGKVGFGKEKSKIEFILMRIEDDLSSFELPSNYVPEYGYNVLTPKENLLAGLNGSVRFFKKLDLFFNTGMSAFTADAADTLLIDYGTDAPAFLGELFQANSTTKVALAGDAGVQYSVFGSRLGVKYRRVDPFYTTLASPYFNSDLEQYTFSLGTSLWRRRIRFDGQLGLEKNNLTQLRMNTTHRLIGSGNVHFMPDDQFYTTLTYQNFQTETENRILLLNDTLRFVSVSRNYGLVSGYSWVTANKRLSLQFNAFYNTVRDESETEQIGDIDILSLSASHGHTISSVELTISPSVHYNQYTYSDVVQERIGGGLRLSKRWWEQKLSTSFSVSYSLNNYDGLRDGDTAYFVLNGAYKLSGKSTLSTNLSYRTASSLINRSFDESRASLRYQYQF